MQISQRVVDAVGAEVGQWLLEQGEVLGVQGGPQVQAVAFKDGRHLRAHDYVVVEALMIVMLFAWKNDIDRMRESRVRYIMQQPGHLFLEARAQRTQDVKNA